MRTISYQIPAEYREKKVLSFLRGKAGLSSRLVKSLKQVPNGIMLNGVHTRTIDVLREGDVLTVNIPDDGAVCRAGGIMPEVIYEDDDILVVNKPAMLPIHESHNHQGDTLSNSVAGYLAKKGVLCRFRAVGRLDKGTSGLVVCALNTHAASRLNGKIEKEYLAVACGRFEGEGTANSPIYRPDPMKTIRTVDSRGVPAVTHWRALKTNGRRTLLQIRLETGRTHQIRVHFASLGAPLAGDAMYGERDEKISHQALHCFRLRLVHPVTGEEIALSADMPEDMQKIADEIK